MLRGYNPPSFVKKVPLCVEGENSPQQRVGARFFPGAPVKKVSLSDLRGVVIVGKNPVSGSLSPGILVPEVFLGFQSLQSSPWLSAFPKFFGNPIKVPAIFTKVTGGCFSCPSLVLQEVKIGSNFGGTDCIELFKLMSRIQNHNSQNPPFTLSKVLRFCMGSLSLNSPSFRKSPLLLR